MWFEITKISKTVSLNCSAAALLKSKSPTSVQKQQTDIRNVNKPVSDSRSLACGCSNTDSSSWIFLLPPHWLLVDCVNERVQPSHLPKLPGVRNTLLVDSPAATHRFLKPRTWWQYVAVDFGSRDENIYVPSAASCRHTLTTLSSKDRLSQIKRAKPITGCCRWLNRGKQD